MRQSGLSVPYEILLLAGILDGINFLGWTKTEDAQKNRNRPKSVLGLLTEEKPQTMQTYRSGEEFERARSKLLGEMNGN